MSKSFPKVNSSDFKESVHSSVDDETLQFKGIEENLDVKPLYKLSSPLPSPIHAFISLEEEFSSLQNVAKKLEVAYQAIMDRQPR